MGYGRGAQSNRKNWAVNLIRVNLSLLVVIISDYGQYGGDLVRYKLISVVKADRRQRGEIETGDSALAMGRFFGKFP